MRKANTPYRAGPLYLIQRGETFHITGTHCGKRVRVAAGTDDLRRAKVALDDLLHELESGWRAGWDTADVDWRAIAKAMCVRHRIQAHRRNMPFEIRSDQVYSLMRASGFRCVLSGIAFSKRASATGAADPWAASIDRIDNSHGYLTDNIRVVCLAANFAMNRWGYDTLLRLSKAVVKNSQQAMPEEEKLTHSLISEAA